MAQLDAILRLVAQHGGDAVELVPGVVPAVHADGEPVTLFLPAMPRSAIRDFWADLGGRKPDTLEHEIEALGRFRVTLDSTGTLRAKNVGPADGSVQARAPVEVEAPTPRPRPKPRKRRDAPAKKRAPKPVVSASPGALDTLLHRAHERGASDVHLAHGEPVRVRVDGALQHLAHSDPDAAIAGLAERLGASLDAEVGRAAEGAFTLDGGPRVRASLYRCGDGHAAALRLLPGAAPTLGSLGLPVDISDVARIPHGLVLVCGPTGSGKSTTLAALARATLEARGGALLTLEEPVEYTIEVDRPGVLVRQREVGRDVPDFATGLRDALRADPDVMLIGEMRDPETISLAITAAETGHLVLASLHSRTARSAIERIVDSYPAERQRQVRVQLADALEVSIAQRLLPKRSGKGRAVAMEVMRVNHNVAGLIREGRTAQLTSALQAGGDDGMMMLEKSLAALTRAGLVDHDVARASAEDLGAFADYLR